MTYEVFRVSACFVCVASRSYCLNKKLQKDFLPQRTFERYEKICVYFTFSFFSYVSQANLTFSRGIIRDHKND